MKTTNPTTSSESAPIPTSNPTPATGCCGGPAPEETSGCCALDAEVKQRGGSGCGCGTKAATTPEQGCC